MSPRLLLALLAALPTAGLATAAAAQSGGSSSGRPAAYRIPGDRVFPEGIAREPGSSRFFVGSTTDGTIFAGDLRRRALTRFAVPGVDGRTTAIGMKADRRGNLVVAGGATGKVFVLSTRNGRTRDVLDTGATGAGVFLNDVAIAGEYAYVTDSKRPVLFRVKLGRDGAAGPVTRFATYPASVLTNDPAVNNANGIAIDPRGRYAIVVQSNTGKLFRVDLRTRAVTAVGLRGGATVPMGDGILFDGTVLYVSRNAAELIVPVRLTDDGRQGVVGTGVTGPQLKFPTTLAQDGSRLLAVNAQFDKRMMGSPVLPFDVARIGVPRAPGPIGTPAGSAGR